METEDLEESVETVIAGEQKKGAIIAPEEKRIISYHEIGHAMVAACQTHSAPVQKITIVPRTSGALGYTMQVDEGEKHLLSKQEMLNRIATLTGGRAAEEVMCHTCTTGASNDIEKATQLARAMVTTYGMSDTYGMMQLEQQTNRYLGGRSSLTCSEATARNYSSPGLVTIAPEHPENATLNSGNVTPTAGAIKDSVMYVVGFDDDFNTIFYSVDTPTVRLRRSAQYPNLTARRRIWLTTTTTRKCISSPTRPMRT